MIEISKIIKPTNASDGAGVKLKRSIGVEPNYYDPFLMLDEFGSENSEDYVAGFPPHPHRGIETVTYMLLFQFLYVGEEENLQYNHLYFQIQTHLTLKMDQSNLALHQYFFLI